jgi:hypothetical protein
MAGDHRPVQDMNIHICTGRATHLVQQPVTPLKAGRNADDIRHAGPYRTEAPSQGSDGSTGLRGVSP